jgi:NADPH2:quinone reductase
MKAIEIRKYGDINSLEVTNIAMPELKNDEVLIKNVIAGVNFIDIYMRKGDPMIQLPLPFIPGVEGAGFVEKVGPDVKDLLPGNRVAYIGSIGSYAEYTIVSLSKTIALPDYIDFYQAGALMLQGLTAQYLAEDSCKIFSKTNVLLHSAAGGVGLFLLQMLKHKGAKVFATVSSLEKKRLVENLGADVVLLSSEEDFAKKILEATFGKGVDVIYDGAGQSTFLQNLEACAIQGHIVIYGHTSGAIPPMSFNILQQKSLTVTGGNLMNYLTSRQELTTRASKLMHQVKQKKLLLHIDKVFPLAQAHVAQSYLESRRSIGKVLLEI